MAIPRSSARSKGAVELVGLEVGLDERARRADGRDVLVLPVLVVGAAVEDQAVALRPPAAGVADVDVARPELAQLHQLERAEVADAPGWSHRERGGHVPAELCEVVERAHIAMDSAEAS